MFIVEVRDKTSRKEHSERTGELDLSIFQNTRSKRPYENTRVCHTVKFVSSSRGKPFRFEVATLPRAQTAHWTVEFRFEVVRACVRICAHGRHAVAAQP